MSKTAAEKAMKWSENGQTASAEQARSQERRRRKAIVAGHAGQSAPFVGLRGESGERDRDFEMTRCSAEAWSVQFGGFTRWVDLKKVGVDSLAVEQIPPEVAVAFQLIPLRSVGEKLLAAVPRHSELPAEELGRLLGRDLQLVWADAKQIRAAIEWHYGVKFTPA
jgi:hypothetical protein